jgi:hypothetical protein
MQSTRTTAAATAAATAATVRDFQSNNVLWSLHLECHCTEVLDSASASACTTLAAVLLKSGLHVRTLQSQWEYVR